MFTHGPTTTPPTTACVCGWNTPDHNGDMIHPDKCPAILAAVAAMRDNGVIAQRMERWAAHYIDPADVAVIVLEAVQQAQADALTALAEAFEPAPAPPRLYSVPTASRPLTLDPHEAYYRPPYTGRAAA